MCPCASRAGLTPMPTSTLRQAGPSRLSTFALAILGIWRWVPRLADDKASSAPRSRCLRRSLISDEYRFSRRRWASPA